MVIFFIICNTTIIAPHSEPPDYPRSDLKKNFNQIYTQHIKRRYGRYTGSEYGCQYKYYLNRQLIPQLATKL